jgi:hypothetical protein
LTEADLVQPLLQQQQQVWQQVQQQEHALGGLLAGDAAIASWVFQVACRQACKMLVSLLLIVQAQGL